MCISQLQISLQCHHLQQNPSLGWYLRYLEKKKIKLNLSGGKRHKRVKKISRGTKWSLAHLQCISMASAWFQPKKEGGNSKAMSHENQPGVPNIYLNVYQEAGLSSIPRPGRHSHILLTPQ